MLSMGNTYSVPALAEWDGNAYLTGLLRYTDTSAL